MQQKKKNLNRLPFINHLVIDMFVDLLVDLRVSPNFSGTPPKQDNQSNYGRPFFVRGL